MKHFSKLQYTLGGFVVFATLVGLAPIDRATEPARIQASVKSAQAESARDYAVKSAASEIVHITPGATVPVVFEIKNTGEESWWARSLRLGTAYPTGDGDRPSRWADTTWISNTRIAPTNATGEIGTGESVEFYFTVKAPAYPGLYRETFRPVLDNYRWLNGDLLTVSFEVAGGEAVQSAIHKEVRVYLANQTAELVEDGFIVASLPISSGKPGYDTPVGQYHVMNKLSDTKSQRYGVWMGNWMGIVKDGEPFEGYGMHSLAYWPVKAGKYTEGEMYDGRLYTNGRLYEDVEHLGTQMSHGCVRFGIYESGVVYKWVDVGTPVTIV